MHNLPTILASLLVIVSTIIFVTGVVALHEAE